MLIKLLRVFLPRRRDTFINYTENSSHRFWSKFENLERKIEADRNLSTAQRRERLHKKYVALEKQRIRHEAEMTAAKEQAHRKINAEMATRYKNIKPHLVS